MALGGLGAILISGHPTHVLGHVFSKVDFRSLFFAMVIVVIVLVLAYLTNPSETSFRTHLTELHIKEHIRQLEGPQDESSTSQDSAAHFTLSRRTPPTARKLGSTFDPKSPFHFVSRASVSLRTPKHVFQNFGILSIAAVYPPSRYTAQGNGHAAQSENITPSVFDAWYIGLFGTWWRGGIVQSWWHEMLESTKDAERCGSGLLDIRALDALEEFDGLPLPTSSRLPTEVNNSRGPERSTQRTINNAPRSTTPPPLPKSASLPLHAPRAPAATPPKGNGSSNPRHASNGSASLAPEQLRLPAPPMLAYSPSSISPSSISLWDSSPIIAEVLRQISQSKAAVRELHSQLNDFRMVSSESRQSIQSELEAQRERKRQDDAARAELKSRTKTLEDSKRSAESSKRDAEKRLRAAESARSTATARIEKLGEEIGVLCSKMRDDERAIESCKEEGAVKEQDAQESLEKKRKEIKVAEDVVAALSMRAKELEEKIVHEEERLRRAKEQAELKRQDRSFYPLTIVPAVSEEDITIPAWPLYGGQNQLQDSPPGTIMHHSAEGLDHREVAFPHPIQAPKSSSSGSGSSDTGEPSISPRPARLSLTGISNLRDPVNGVLPEPDPSGQVLLRTRGFLPLAGDLPSTVSTTTRFSPFDSDGQETPSSSEAPPSASISPSTFIPASLIRSLYEPGGFDMNPSRSFQSDDDTVLSRDWRKNTPFSRPLPVENPATGQYTMSPSSLVYPSFEGVDNQDPFEIRPLPTRRRLTSELMDLQRATLPPARTISDPTLPPVALTVTVADCETQDKSGLAHRRWTSQQDAPAKERKGLNPEAKAFSLTKRTFPSTFPSQPQPHAQPQTQAQQMPHAHAFDFDPLGAAPALAMGMGMGPEPDGGNVFSSISMRAFAPSPAEREALLRALGGSTNASLERLPTLSEVSSVSSGSLPSMPSLSLSASSPSSPSHSHSLAHAVPPPPGLGPHVAGMGMGVHPNASLNGAGRTTGPFCGTSLSWLQSLPRGHKPKFSPWEDEEPAELEVGGGGGR